MVGGAEVELVHGAAAGRGDERAVGGAVRAALEHGDRARAVLVHLPGGGERAVVRASQNRIACHVAVGFVQAHGRGEGGFGPARVEAAHARAEADVEVALAVHGHAQRADRPGETFAAAAVDDPRRRKRRAVRVKRGGDLAEEHARAREARPWSWLLAPGDRPLAEPAHVERELIGGAVERIAGVGGGTDLQDVAGRHPEDAPRVDAVDERVVGLLPGDEGPDR